MKTSTWRAINVSYGDFPERRAVGVADSEIQSASERLGVPFPIDYIEFLKKCGGGCVGSYSIAGLRRWESASAIASASSVSVGIGIAHEVFASCNRSDVICASKHGGDRQTILGRAHTSASASELVRSVVVSGSLGVLEIGRAREGKVFDQAVVD